MGLAGKLRITEGARVLVLGAPDGFSDLLSPLPDGASMSSTARGRFGVVIWFVKTAADLEKGLAKALAALDGDAAFWICYPKKSSGIESDLTRDKGWKAVFDAGYGPVSQSAVDSVWSAVRFRQESLVKRKEGSVVAPTERKPQAKAAKGEKKSAAPLAPPADLAERLGENASAKATWDTLAPSHRKEYVGWIEEAKKPETRARRLDKTVEMLAAGVRDRNEKYAGR